MNNIRIRKPFAAAFTVLCLASAYLGFAPEVIPRSNGRYLQHTDKGLHFVTFFLLTLTFYWILESTRRRVLNITLAVCTGGLACGSEFVQGAIPNNGREFDPWDILANVVGSLAALAVCAWYHRRMLERKRANKTYTSVPGDEETGGGAMELAEGTGVQETGITAAPSSGIGRELDEWDENAEDEWDDQDPDQTNGHTDVIVKDKRDD